MKIVYGYDIMTFNGPLPNCLNPKFIPTIYEGSKYNYRESYDHFNKTWGCDYSVFNSNDYDQIIERRSVYNIIDDRKENKNYKWFYIIEPHSGLDLFFGHHKVHDQFLLENIPDVSLNEIINHNGNILINYVVDGGLGINESNLKMIVDFTRKNKIKDEKVFFIFSDFKLKENFKKLNVNYNVIDFNFYLHFKSSEFNKLISNQTNTVVTYEDYEKNISKDKKDFLLLTRHWKQHRIFLLSQLHRLGLSNNLVSWEKSYYNENMINKLYEYDKNEEFGDMVKETSKYIDVSDLINVSGYGFENKEMYLNTYISIVTESIFFQVDPNYPTGFLSEKIWKPIGHCQPFILAGPSKSLNYIKERYNFKTFDPYIDESYDLVEDDMERLKLIQIEIDKFSKKTKEEKIKFLNDVKDICFYNQKLFLDLGKKYNNPLQNNDELKLISNFLTKSSLI
jgi:hypothetical protein